MTHHFLSEGYYWRGAPHLDCTILFKFVCSGLRGVCSRKCSGLAVCWPEA